MKLLQTIALMLVSVFAPTKVVLSVVLVLALVDLLVGLLAAKKQGDPITSTGLKRTVVKLFVYELATLMAFLVGEYLVPLELPIMKMVTGLIGMTELKSILENLDIIAGGSFFRSVVNQLQTRLNGDQDDEKQVPDDSKDI